MFIKYFRDYSAKGERVEIIRPCRDCQQRGSLAISNGHDGLIVHFEHDSEVADLISELRKERGDGAQV